MLVKCISILGDNILGIFTQSRNVAEQTATQRSWTKIHFLFLLFHDQLSCLPFPSFTDLANLVT